jgi:DNA-binding SARP family transcriptional activator/pimeloyl-ACP methyl ester carboxylesterase
MEFKILGPLEVVDDGGVTVPLPTGKQGALLARLVLDANHVVALRGLIDDLWGDLAPDSAAKTVQIYVSQLRKRLGKEPIRTRPPGYLLAVEPQQVDLFRFEQLLAEGKQALEQDDPSHAATLLRDALGLWRGPALEEFSEPFAQPESARLEELRLQALEERIEADLMLGRHADLISELEPHLAHHPLRERLRAQQLLALYRCGRHADALAAYQEYRQLLDDQLGIEPSTRLKQLQRRILQQDPQLEIAQPSPGRSPLRLGPAAAVGLPSGQAEIRYARSGDVRIAYQVIGEGDVDVMLVHGWVCTFQPGWENASIAAFYRRLASMGRLILFDKRGTGLSDRVPADRLPDLETRMDDVRAVLDAVGSDRAAMLGISEGGSMTTLFAATHPERVIALVLLGTFARMMQAADYPVGISEHEYRRRLVSLDEDDWALTTTKEWLARVAPSVLYDEEALRWYVSYVQRGASPAANRALRLMNREIDIRNVLPTIVVPTLVLFRADEVHAERTRFMAESIPGAKLVALPGEEHLPWEGDQGSLLAEIERFLAATGAENVELDRVLVTVLFTDIVDSTARAVELGDRAWQQLLDRYYALVRSRLTRFRGRLIDAAEDGVLAVFDGPGRAIHCACAISGDVRLLGLEVRTGLHTGEVERENGSVRGVAVQIGARVAAEAPPGEVLVSSTVKDLVAGSGIAFADRGEHSLEGIPGEWRLFAVQT